MLTEETYLRLINYASKAPSSHNTQPWKFRKEEDTILIIPDFSRALPVVDPDNHALFISLGCALENLLIAAEQYGFRAGVEDNRKREEDPVKVRLTALSAEARAEKLEQLRQTEKLEQSEQLRQSEQSEQLERSEQLKQSEQLEQQEQSEQPEQPEQSEQLEQPEQLEQLEQSELSEQLKLFAQIKPRQVTKGPYREEELDGDVIQKIDTIPLEPGIRMRLILPGRESEQLLPLVIQGSDRQFANKAFVSELVDWLRFSEKEAVKKGDGIWNATMGLPATGRLAGSFIMKHLVSPRSEAKRWEKLFRQSGGFVLFMTAQNDACHWIRLGRSFQRFGLATSAMGLKHAHMNMPLEEETVREKLIATLDLGEMTPLLLLRIGYAAQAPYSFRRNLHEMMER